jgi:predicted transcriptional regulator
MLKGEFKMKEEKIEVRDLRNGDWLWVHKAVIFNKLLFTSDKLVYCGLACYAHNQSQSSFPSINRLRKELNIGKNTLIRSLARLKENGFIKIEKQSGKHNIYTLLKIETRKSKLKKLEKDKRDLVEKKDINNL